MNPTRLKLGGFILLLLLAALAVSIIGRDEATRHLTMLVADLRALGPLGWLLFFALQALVALIGFLPASLLGIAAGAALGLPVGFAVSSLGIIIGALGAFALARSVFRPAIAGFVARHNRLARLDALLARDGWKLVCLLRISPIMPFSLTSYALGLSAIGPGAYMLGTLASLPALFLYVWLGALTSSLTTQTPTIHILLLGIGLIATIALTIRLGQITARGLRSPQA